MELTYNGQQANSALDTAEYLGHKMSDRINEIIKAIITLIILLFKVAIRLGQIVGDYYYLYDVKSWTPPTDSPRKLPKSQTSKKLVIRRQTDDGITRSTGNTNCNYPYPVRAENGIKRRAIKRSDQS